jgi:hypothetical protein
MRALDDRSSDTPHERPSNIRPPARTYNDHRAMLALRGRDNRVRYWALERYQLTIDVCFPCNIRCFAQKRLRCKPALMSAFGNVDDDESTTLGPRHIDCDPKSSIRCRRPIDGDGNRAILYGIVGMRHNNGNTARLYETFGRTSDDGACYSGSRVCADNECIARSLSHEPANSRSNCSKNDCAIGDDAASESLSYGSIAHALRIFIHCLNEGCRVDHRTSGLS